MGDSIEDPFDNSDAEDQEIEKPRTPDYHDGRQEEQEDVEAFSDISDERGNEKHEEEDSKESSVQAVVDSPDSEVMVGSPEEKDEEERKDIREHVDEEELSPVSSGVTETSPKKDNEDSKDGEENNDEEEERDDEITEEKFVDEKRKSESEESVEKEERGSHDGSPDDPNSTSQKMSEEPSDISRDGPKDGNDEDEDLEMPLSPIGDLGLSEPEAAIVDDILKGDVSEMMPGHKVEVSQGEDNGGIKSTGDDDDDDEETSIKETEEEAKSPQEADDDEGVNVNKPNSEEADDQDEERSEPEEAGEQLIADIFGASDEEEEFEGFDQEDIDLSKAKQGGSKKTSKPMISDDDDDDDDDVNDNEVTGQVTDSMVVPKPKVNKEKQIDSDEDDGSYRGQVWDFDVMMEQKKASRSKRRRKNDGDLISDNDDLVVEMIKKMQEAAEEDKMLNEAKQAATKKLKLLPLILKHLNKADLQFTFIDSGILNGIKEWLSPLPDGSLPHLQIRTGLLKILSAFPALDTGALKMSGLGKAVMYIYRHPKEIRQNKDMAGKLINEWARPIFGVTSNFKSMSREEREERDYQNMSKRRRLSSTDEGSRTPRSIDKAIQGEKKAARPGEKGFIMRARVPTPSNKDYVVRPKSNLDTIEFQRNSPKVLSRADKQMRKFKDRNKAKNASRITISIEGRKMGL